MGTITRTTCDNCAIETNNIYDEIGWLIIDSHGAVGANSTLTLTQGRDDRKNAKTNFKSSRPIWHFCSLKCFNVFMRKE